VAIQEQASGGAVVDQGASHSGTVSDGRERGNGGMDGMCKIRYA